jgi:hypothetical protein
MEPLVWHVVDGDAVGEKIQAIGGQTLVWREMYDMGPVRLCPSGELLAERARYFESWLRIPAELFSRSCATQERVLGTIPRHAEVVLWFAHERYDQTMLLYLLSRMRSLGFDNVFMVSVDRYPGIEPFIGLGQLSAGQLGQVYDARRPLSEAQIAQGVSAWEAYASLDPRVLAEWTAAKPVILPYVHDAFRAHLACFPSVRNGLGAVEELALSIIRGGCRGFRTVLRQISAQRPQLGISDFHLSALLRSLTSGDEPLLEVVGGTLPDFMAPTVDAELEITGAGKAVLDGRRDRLECSPLDWWLGGTHLTGEDDWRWDGKQIVRA